MKLLVLVVLSVLFLESFGGVVKHNDFRSKSESEARDELKDELDELFALTKPVLDASLELHQQVTSYKIQQEVMTLAASMGDFNINSEACNKLSNDLVSAGEIAQNTSLDVYHMIINVTNTLGGMTGCVSWNPVDAVKCYVNDINNVINNVRSIKPTIVKALHLVISISKNLKPEFMECIGNGPTTARPTTLPPTTKVTTELATSHTTTTKKPSCWYCISW